MNKIFVAIALTLAPFVPAHAQTSAVPSSSTTAAAAQSSGPVKNPIATSLRTMFPGRQKNILAAIDAMPADKFSYKPTPDQMSFAHLVMHITESNNAECALLADTAAPKGDELKETDSKDKLLSAARASFEFCSSALANLDDSKMADPVTFFGHMQGPRAMAAFFLSGGWADHYGAAAMYLRLNGILPPTAQSRK